MNFLNRSLMLVAADDRKAIELAAASSADAVILDLKGKIAPERRAAAREPLLDALRGMDFGTNEFGVPKQVVVRVNRAGSEWFQADLAALESDPAILGRVDVLMLPQVESRADIEALAERAPSGKPLWLVFESVKGVADIEGIMEAPDPRIEALFFGNNDFCTDSGIPKENLADLEPVERQIIAAAKRAKTMVFAGGSDRLISDGREQVDTLRRAERLGYTGKVCFSAGQVEAINELFAPERRSMGAQMPFAHHHLRRNAMAREAGSERT